jgi:hypothetical protein
VVAAALILAVCLVTRLPYFGFAAATTDEQLYSAIGRAMIAGELPYVDVWDRKPIGLFLLFALGHWLGGPGPLGYQAIGLLSAVLGGWLVYRIANRTAPPLTATIAACLYPIGMALLGSHSGQSEIFWTLPMLVMVWCLLRFADEPGAPGLHRLAATAMLAGGVALQIKYTVAPQCAMLGLAALWLGFRQGARPAVLARRAACYLALGLAPTLVAALAYALMRHGEAFVFANVQSIWLREGAAGIDPRVAPLLALLAVLWLAGGLYLLIVAPERQSTDHPIVFAWLAGAVATLFMGSTVYAYYLAGLVAPTILAALPFLDERNRFGAVPGLALLILSLVKYDPAGRYHDRLEREAELTAITARLAEATERADGFLFVYDGPTALYGPAGRRPPSILLYPDHFNNRLERAALPVDPAQEARRLIACLPAVVVRAAPPMTEQNLASAAALQEGLARGYRLIARRPFEGRQIAIFRRTDDPEGAREGCARPD